MIQRENKEKKPKEIRLTRKQIVIIVVSLILLVAITIAVVCVVKNHTALNKENDQTSNVDNNTDNSGSALGGEEVEFKKVTALQGNTSITPEREVLLEANIINRIEKTQSYMPILNSNNSYYTDANGRLEVEEIRTRDYSGMKENLIVIANSFADDGYPIEPIWYAQRLYFEYYEYFSEYSSDELLPRLKQVFLKSGNTLEAVNQRVYDVFGIDREDKCEFVFNDVMSSVDLTPSFYAVEINLPHEWKEEYEDYCIYDQWMKGRSESEYTQNAEHNLHIIICKMLENGMREYDIRLAQLLYTSYIADLKYRSDWLDQITVLFGEGTPDYVFLCETMNAVFGEDMNSNIVIANYYDGISEYLGGAKK